MEAGAVAQPDVDVGGRVIESSPTRGGEPLGQPPHGLVVRERDVHPLQTLAPVDIDLVAPVDEYVGDIGHAQQWLQRTRADDVAPQRLVHGQHRGVADRSTRRA